MRILETLEIELRDPSDEVPLPDGVVQVITHDKKRRFYPNSLENPGSYIEFTEWFMFGGGSSKNACTTIVHRLTVLREIKEES